MKSRFRSLFKALQRHEWTALAFVYLLAAVIADALDGPGDNLSDFYVVVPILLALEWSWVVVVLSTLPLVFVTATNLFGKDTLSAEAVLVRTVLVGLGGLVGAYITITRERRASTLAKTQEVAEAAQLAILLPVPDEIGPYRFAALYRSASEEALVGGDFYSVVTTQFGVRILVGDVQGKGIQAVQLSALVMGCFREWAPELAKLRSLVTKLEDRIIASAPGNEFVTAIVATLEDDLTVELANCGHPSPVVFSGARELRLDPEHRSVPLGLGADPMIERWQLHAADRVLFYTDALTEARDRRGRFIPFEELSRNLATEPLDNALGDVLARLEKQAGRLRDDSATLLVECGSQSQCGGITVDPDPGPLSKVQRLT